MWVAVLESSFSLYTVPGELHVALQTLKYLGQVAMTSGRS